MRDLNQWLQEYAVSHQNPTNVKIHMYAVPAIMFSLLGMMWSIPTPDFFPAFSYLNWSTLFCLACLCFYLSLSTRVFISMTLLLLPFVFIFNLWQTQLSSLPLFQTNLGIFIVAWIFQFVGHKIEGKKPSFFQDLVFLLIGPIWVFKKIAPSAIQEKQATT